MAYKKLYEYLRDDNLYYVPEIFDCMSTKAAEINGFKMVMISSSDFSCAYTGIPDLKLLTVDEYAAMAERITNMTDMPLFIDADEGFGRPLQTFQGCRRLAKAGTQAILVTDLAANGRPGLLPIDEAVYRFQAAKDGMAGTDCLLLARCDHSVDTDFDEFVERCNRYLEVGADIICPLELNRSKIYGSKIAAAKKVAEHVKAPFWYPNMERERAEDIAGLREHGYKFVGVHYAFRAAMLAILDAGRHVFESGTNEYIATAHDHTGYKFHYSPMSAFFRGGEWVNRERQYLSNPDEALAVRLEKHFTGPTDKF
ncbi:isocitrate lyase/PEP mutase family protein [Agrobacterium sp. SORGH_AS 787]|uniref:isocitrate lyase/PEP mutase family protein n=1 Tax=Agrobacterium sp. SORGH_AS 787 TaxID=3041775 RepID=UPI00277EA9C3|nr:methylisocitrate lyase [Rhizobium sp. SORGH_AS_0787]